MVAIWQPPTTDMVLVWKPPNIAMVAIWKPPNAAMVAVWKPPCTAMVAIWQPPRVLTHGDFLHIAPNSPHLLKTVAICGDFYALIWNVENTETTA